MAEGGKPGKITELGQTLVLHEPRDGGDIDATRQAAVLGPFRYPRVIAKGNMVACLALNINTAVCIPVISR